MASRDLLALRSQDPDRFNSAAVQRAIAEASGLAVFYAWVFEVDYKDEHLILETDADGACHIAAVDFGQSFGWADVDAGWWPAGLPPALRPRIEAEPIEIAVQAIAAIPDDHIRCLVAALPGPLPDAGRERIARGLVERKPKLRDYMAAQGRLPSRLDAALA